MQYLVHILQQWSPEQSESEQGVLGLGQSRQDSDIVGLHWYTRLKRQAQTQQTGSSTRPKLQSSQLYQIPPINLKVDTYIP